MADSTKTASMAGSGVMPKAIHAGVNSIVSVYSLTATLSASDKIFMCKLPHGARVLSMTLMSNVNLFADAGVLNVGTPDSATRFIASVTPSANLSFTINQAAGLGWLNDISDDASQQFTYVQLSCSTAVTGTKSGAITLALTYQMDVPV